MLDETTYELLNNKQDQYSIKDRLDYVRLELSKLNFNLKTHM